MIKLDNENKLIPAHMTEPYKNDGNNYIDRLPDELMLKIFEYLGVKNLGRVARVCREWCNLSEDDALWNHFLKQDFQKSKSVAKAKEIYREKYFFTINFSKGIYKTQIHYGSVIGSANAMLVDKEKRIVARRSEIEIFPLTIDQSKPMLLRNEGLIHYLLKTKSKKLVSISNNNDLVSGKKSVMMKVWDPKTGKCEKTFEPNYHMNACSCLITKQGKLALGSDDGKIFIWDLNSDRYEQQLELTSRVQVTHLLETAEEKLVSSSYSDSTIKIWEHNGRYAQELKGHTQGITSLLCINANKLITGSRDKNIKIWDLTTGICERTLTGHRGGEITSLLLANEGRWLVSSCIEGYINWWDLKSGERTREHLRYQKGMNCLFEATKEKFLCFTDGNIEVWDLNSGNCDYTLSTPQFLTYALFKKRGQLISSEVSWNFTVSNEEVFTEIAEVFTLCSSMGISERCLQVTSFQIRFDKMPEKEKNQVYSALYEIIKYSLPKGQDTWGCAEKAFHGERNYCATLSDKAQAICNYLQSKERSEAGKIAVLFATGLDKEGMKRFLLLSEVERNAIYEELYPIIQPSLVKGQDTWGCAEKAFHNQEGYVSTSRERVQAIRNYINK